ncbi:hypothetical protein [Halorubellus sp. PRR65]|uniref:hypothetical protein n=2 Tax=Halobacteriales TaxID=2235 RepID=UPI002B263281|nr:hypothetical protein [Halorubellus sp. PRR65]
MSQRIVFEVLSSFNNPVTKYELTDKIEEEYPERSLSDYAGGRLSVLVDKGAVLEEGKGGKATYQVNPEYDVDDLGVLLTDFDRETSREELESHGIEVTNIVGNGTFSQTVDLQQLGAEVLNVEYEPETSPMAVWRPFEQNAATVLVPSSGRITIVGSKNRSEIQQAISEIYDRLPPYAEEITSKKQFIREFQITNIATSASLSRELELSEVALGIGLEETEYNPEQFPGVIYRPLPGVVTLLFRSGSVVITANSYSKVLDGWKALKEALKEIGVQINEENQME